MCPRRAFCELDALGHEIIPGDDDCPEPVEILPGVFDCPGDDGDDDSGLGAGWIALIVLIVCAVLLACCGAACAVGEVYLMLGAKWH